MNDKLKYALLLIVLICSKASAQIGIEQFGDSTTSGLTYNGSTYVNSSPTAPDQLYIDMQARFPGQVLIYNRGVPSTCARDLLNGTPSFTDRMASSTASIITLNYGMNDGFYCNQTVSQYSSQMDQLTKIAIASGKMVVLIEPNPTTNSQNPNLYNYIGALSQVAISNGVPIIQHYRLWQSGEFWRSLLSDGTHPTPAGYRLKGDTEFQVLSPMVQKLLNN